LTSVLLAGGAGTLAVGVAGCNILGPATYFVLGPDKVPAAYELDKDKTAVIFVDDRANRIPSRASREMIGKTAEETLLEKGVVKDMIQSRSIQAVVARERFGKPMAIAEVGRAVNADVVIYAWIDSFSMTADGQTYLPTASLRVKVIDCATTERLFPSPEAPEAWYPFTISLPQQQGFVPTSNAEVAKAEQDLAKWVGLSLARLFFAHDSPRGETKIEQAPGQ
jgi:hypothetical protein